MKTKKDGKEDIRIYIVCVLVFLKLPGRRKRNEKKRKEKKRKERKGKERKD